MFRAGQLPTQRYDFMYYCILCRQILPSLCDWMEGDLHTGSIIPLYHWVPQLQRGRSRKWCHWIPNYLGLMALTPCRGRAKVVDTSIALSLEQQLQCSPWEDLIFFTKPPVLSLNGWPLLGNIHFAFSTLLFFLNYPSFITSRKAFSWLVRGQEALEINKWKQTHD